MYAQRLHGLVGDSVQGHLVSQNAAKIGEGVTGVAIGELIGKITEKTMDAVKRGVDRIRWMM